MHSHFSHHTSPALGVIASKHTIRCQVQHIEQQLHSRSVVVWRTQLEQSAAQAEWLRHIPDGLMCMGTSLTLPPGRSESASTCLL